MKLEVQHLSFSYENKTILKQLSFSIKEGEFVSLLGPSGCGKSTILKLLTAIIPPKEGCIRVDGELISGVSGHFAYMPQNDLLLPWKTILENVCLYGQIHHQLEETQKRAKAFFPLFGLSGYEHAYPAELSGGMRQRAAFLRTALCQADILLLDEPFGALDVITRAEMQDWLLQLRTSMNKTVLLVTHDIDEALYLSDRILILKPFPLGLTAEFQIPDRERSRDWLYTQSARRKELYHAIQKKEEER